MTSRSGTPSYSYEWRNVVPHVEAAGYCVIAYDLLGYGDSERPLDRDTSVAAQTDLLVGLVDVGEHRGGGDVVEQRDRRLELATLLRRRHIMPDGWSCVADHA